VISGGSYLRSLAGVQHINGLLHAAMTDGVMQCIRMLQMIFLLSTHAQPMLVGPDSRPVVACRSVMDESWPVICAELLLVAAPPAAGNAVFAVTVLTLVWSWYVGRGRVSRLLSCNRL